MPNYWLGIMAVAFAVALAVWIGLVFRADRTERKIPGRPVVPQPPREVIGGMFEARKGGRQVMPDPSEPIAHDDETGQAPARPVPAEQVTDVKVPKQGGDPVPEEAPARGEQP